MERFLIRGKVNEGGSSSEKGKDDKVSPVKLDESDQDQESESEKDNSDNQEISDDEGEVDEVRYVVERIDDKRVDDDGITYYFIKWQGWDVSSNTWEPLENLDDCKNLLAQFEKRYSEGNSGRKISRGRKRKGFFGGTVVTRDEDEDDDEFEKPKSNIKAYCVFDEWRANMEPLSVEGVIQVDGELTYIVKQNTRRGGSSSQLDRSNAVLVKAANFRQVYPEMVIDYYQSRVIWGSRNGEEESKDQIEVARQIKKLCKLDTSGDEDDVQIVKDTIAIRSEEDYAIELSEDLEDTDLSSGMTSVSSVNEWDLDSETCTWMKGVLEEEIAEPGFPA